MDFAVPADHRVKLKESEKKDKYLGLTRERKKTMVMVIPVVIGALGTISKGLVKGLEKLKNKNTSGDHPDYSIIKVGQNTEKNVAD